MTIRERSDAEARAIVELIEGEIRHGRLVAGSRLPPEKDLCARHRASRHTVRKAMSTLERRGLVVRSVGRGSFVRGPCESIRLPSADPIPGDAGPRWSLFELTEARLLFEPGIASLVVERATPEDHARFAEALAAIERADDWRSFKQTKYAFHLAVVRAARNDFLTFVFEQIVAARERSAWSRPGSSAIALDAVKDICLAESRAILEALSRRDAAACAEAIRRSLYRILSVITA